MENSTNVRDFGPRGTVLRDRAAADRAHVAEQAIRHLGDQVTPRQARFSAPYHNHSQLFATKVRSVQRWPVSVRNRTRSPCVVQHYLVSAHRVCLGLLVLYIKLF